MMLSDARNEVVRKISEKCGFAIDEQKLSPHLRESITSAAEIMKQLSVIRNLLLVEKHDSERFMNRLKSKITGKEDQEIAQYLDQLSGLHKSLDQRIELLAEEVYEELQTGWSNAGEEKKPIIEQLKCQSCGAPLKVPSSFIAKCEYCGTEYKLSDYLDLMHKNLSVQEEGQEKKTDNSQ